jgi:saccharopine dehydrogenase-like NADP-dependent oxidoreductase
MRIGIVGAGAMGAYVAREIVRSAPGTELTIVDADGERAARLAALCAQPASAAQACDAADVGALAAALRGCTVVANAAQYEINLEVMQAALSAGAHYLDLGGMFHMTRRQLALGPEFERAGLTAILGIGAAPGLSNVLARHACQALERVESIAASFAAAAPDAPPSEIFVPPYSIRTIMQEFCEDSMQFLEGEITAQPPLAGRRTIEFPAPIGAVNCVYTLHSEPATLPLTFRDKGVREVTWRLGLPPALEAQVAAFAAAGLGRSRPLAVAGTSIAPVEFLAACIDDHARGQRRDGARYLEFGCVRVEARGVIGERATEVAIDCLYRDEGAPPEVAGIMTGTPAAIAALMLARGEAARPGAHGAEAVVPSESMIRELRQRAFSIVRTVRTAL